MTNMKSNDIHLKKDRNAFVTLLKFLFTMTIVAMHYSVPFKTSYMFEGGYVFVDFFFILQGFYLRKGNETIGINNAKAYLFNRLRRFLPCVLLSSILMFCVQIPCMTGLKDVARRIRELLVQISFLGQMITENMLGVGGILWFLSASIIVGVVVVLAWTRYADNIYVICFFGCVLIYNYIFVTNGNLDYWHDTFHGLFKVGILRGLAGVLLGMFLKYVSLHLNKNFYKYWVVIMSRFLVAVILVVIYFVIIFIPHTKLDYVLVIGFSVLLFILNYQENNIKYIFMDLLDSLCMPVYLFQVVAISITNFVVPRTVGGMVVAIVVDVLMALCWVKIISNIKIDYKKFLLIFKDQIIKEGEE